MLLLLPFASAEQSQAVDCQLTTERSDQQRQKCIKHEQQASRAQGNGPLPASSFGEQAYPGWESASSNLRLSVARPFEELRLPPKRLPVKQENHDLHKKM
jgi:hypothetical protein